MDTPPNPCSPASSQPPAGNHCKRTNDARAAWLHGAKFGMFIHWGLYSSLARGEWVMHQEKIPVDQYAPLAETFNPESFDAKQWVAIAKSAGMAYLTITAKHHDGFCLFPSEVDDYNIVAGSPYQRDVIQELKDACDEADIKFGVYYSHAQDWFHPGGACNGPKWDPAQEGELRTYLDTVAIPQIKELLTRYQPSHLWFDTPHDMTPELASELMDVIRQTKPDTLVNSRLLYHGYQIADLTPERLDELVSLDIDFLSYRDREIPASSPWAHWETCMTLNHSWGYTKSDHAWKSPEKVVRQLIEVVSKGGAFLLNVGPTAEGLIPEPSVEMLRCVGDWLNAHGESIYNASPCPLSAISRASTYDTDDAAAQEKNARQTGAGQASSHTNDHSEYAWLTTRRKNTVYVHLFDWPDGELVIPGLDRKVSSAVFLNDPTHTPLGITQDGGAAAIQIPSDKRSELVPVIRLVLAED